MTEAWTVQRILSWMTQDFVGLGVASPRLDAEILLAHVLGYDRVRLYMEMPRPLVKAELDAIRALVQRRRKREPVAYIVGRKEFYQHAFEVSAAVLVPRPDTELLVDLALERLPKDAADEQAVLDLCTGSGAVALSIAAARAHVRAVATDISSAALELAKRNAVRLQLDARVAFHEGDLFAALPSPQRFALITANPPYVTEAAYAELAPEITQHEPKLALTAGADGLDVLRRICAQAAEWLEPGGAVLLEIGHDQARAVCALLEQTGRFEAVEPLRDFGGNERVVRGVLTAG